MATEKTIDLQIGRAQVGDPSAMGDILSHQAHRARWTPIADADALVSLSQTQVETKRKNNDNQ